MLAGGVAAARHWPYTQAALLKRMEEKFSSKIRITSFRQTFFPHPGCVAEGVTLIRNGERNAAPLATIRKVSIQGSYSGLLSSPRRVTRVVAEGLHVTIPAHGLAEPPPRPNAKKPDMVVGEFVADGSVLDVAPAAQDKDSLRFQMRRLTLASVERGQPFTFRATFLNPEPPGEVSAAGRFGPMHSGDMARTPISGTYSFRHADLGVFPGITGLLSSEGKFDGPLGDLKVEGTTGTPDFALKRSKHPIPVSTSFQAIVNGTTGDVILKPVDARMLRTRVIFAGNIAGKSGQPGKTVTLDLASKDGRIQDLLRLILKSPRPPLSGAITFQGKAVVPPEHRKFIEKLFLMGDFGIGSSRFTSGKTQGNVNLLSERAQGGKDYDDPESVVSDIHGHVVLRNGTATLSHLSFSVPGAFAYFDGTYNLLNEHINLAGTLRMDATVSQATKGVKSFLLKAVDPFFKKKNAGAVLPVKLTGTYSHPVFALALHDKHKHEKHKSANSSGPARRPAT